MRSPQSVSIGKERVRVRQIPAEIHLQARRRGPEAERLQLSGRSAARDPGWPVPGLLRLSSSPEWKASGFCSRPRAETCTP